MRLKQIEIAGFKSFAKKSTLQFDVPISAIVGPNGSGKSNVTEAMRFALGEQSMKTLRGKRGEDLIWNGSHSVPRSNYARVSLTFDNSNKEFDIDYDEVVLKREVHRDGTNNYYINGSLVRLKDINELLAQVHVGASGHHIISQGQADRILNANPKERRLMVEEALGLKIYQWKIEESEKKLAKTEENMKQVESLRREIAPHIRFLKKQVEKVERAREMRKELTGRYAEYLKREAVYLKKERAAVSDARAVPQKELERIETALAAAEAVITEHDKETPHDDTLLEYTKQIEEKRRAYEELARNLGRIEGMIELHARQKETKKEGRSYVAKEEIETLLARLDAEIKEAEEAESIGEVKQALVRMRSIVRRFLNGDQEELAHEEGGPEGELMEEKRTLEERIARVRTELSELERSYESARMAQERERTKQNDAERAILELRAQKSDATARLHDVLKREEDLARAETRFQEEVREGGVLIGRDIFLYESYTLPDEAGGDDRDAQEATRRAIEKLKIKIEDVGAGGGEDVLKEFEEVRKRDSFLEGELADLKNSAESLRKLMVDLSTKLEEDFKVGMQKINAQFQEFFALMFGGGVASLVLVVPEKRRRSDTDIAFAEEGALAEEEQQEEGIDISIALPRKKIKGLQMLSGGERALTSIALIFAVSQVNPPPFLVLDETDAALDEANSRKYGDMLENLSKHSQLVVVTHNRETMSRAGVLYGVTMGSDAVSRLLSVKFDTAADQFAK